ncbi:hypothetical protein [Mammaliicoccus lentus]|jgi:hypothetical protein|uniref:hypothetical protein n=1 Tax=Mammaliicoccus lentus TaxID=42858 RepID=UPI003518024F
MINIFRFIFLIILFSFLLTGCDKDSKSDIQYSNHLSMNESSDFVVDSNDISLINSFTPCSNQKKEAKLTKDESISYFNLNKKENFLCVKLIVENPTDKNVVITHKLFSRNKQLQYSINNKTYKSLKTKVPANKKIIITAKINVNQIKNEISYLPIEKGKEFEINSDNLSLTRLFVEKDEKFKRKKSSSFKEFNTDKDIENNEFITNANIVNRYKEPISESNNQSKDFLKENFKYVHISKKNHNYKANIYIFSNNKNIYSNEGITIKKDIDKTIKLNNKVLGKIYDNESYLVYTTGIGEDVILDYIDIINNKKDAPDSFQNAVKIN